MSPELNGAAPAGAEASFGSIASFGSSVTVWVITALLRKATVWPAFTWIVSGSKLAKPISTPTMPGFTGSCAGPLRPQPANASKPKTDTSWILCMRHLSFQGAWHGARDDASSRERDGFHVSV